jgi:AcrR family transcriptional regulator
VRDGQRSRQRILDAATDEFAAFGIAGARVNRIAAAAGVNKAQMYGWYESKDGLFDAVFDEHLHRIVDAVPLDADDLPGYAAGLYDSYLTDPELVRLASWRRLERTPTGALLAHHPELTDPKADAIADAQRRGTVRARLHPRDVRGLARRRRGRRRPAAGGAARRRRAGVRPESLRAR